MALVLMNKDNGLSYGKIGEPSGIAHRRVCAGEESIERFYIGDLVSVKTNIIKPSPEICMGFIGVSPLTNKPVVLGGGLYKGVVINLDETSTYIFTEEIGQHLEIKAGDEYDNLKIVSVKE
jgi:hypothetical protein